MLPDLKQEIAGVILEDPRIAALADGVTIPSSDFHLARDDMALRASKSKLWQKLRTSP